ncbi:hypothetical protein pb186bvf_003536 [Paramecium bursaria]
MHFGQPYSKQQAQRPQTQIPQYQTNGQINYFPQHYKNQQYQYQQNFQCMNIIKQKEATQKPQQNYYQQAHIQQSNVLIAQAREQQNFNYNAQLKQIMQKSVQQLSLYNQQYQQQQQQQQYQQNGYQQIQNTMKTNKQFQQQYQPLTQGSCFSELFKKYDDDDQVIKSNTQQININEAQPKIYLQLESLYKKGLLIANQRQSLPGCITIRTDENKSQFKQTVDLIIVIDKFGSMFRHKIQKCQNFLLCLLEHLTPLDRLCIIHEGKRLTTLKCVKEANKPYFKKVIQSLEQNGNYSVPYLLEIAIQQIKQRKNTNDKTQIFLLSDGQQYYVKELLSCYLDRLEFPFIIDTFGFGDDHDQQLLSYIASLTNGKFYLVDRLEELTDYLTEALGKAISIVATNVQIQLECYGNLNQQFRIKKLYGKQWKTIQKDSIYLIEFEQILSGAKMDFVFEIFIPQEVEIVAQDTVIQIGKASLKYKSYTNKFFQQSLNLDLIIVDDIKKLNDNKKNMNVAKQLARVQTAEIIERATGMSFANQSANASRNENLNFNEYQKAQELLALSLKNLQQFQQKDVQYLCRDILEAKRVCQQLTEEDEMLQKSINDDRLGIQNQFMDGIYQIPQQQDDLFKLYILNFLFIQFTVSVILFIVRLPVLANSDIHKKNGAMERKIFIQSSNIQIKCFILKHEINTLLIIQIIYKGILAAYILYFQIIQQLFLNSCDRKLLINCVKKIRLQGIFLEQVYKTSNIIYQNIIVLFKENINNIYINIKIILNEYQVIKHQTISSKTTISIYNIPNQCVEEFNVSQCAAITKYIMITQLDSHLNHFVNVNTNQQTQSPYTYVQVMQNKEQQKHRNQVQSQLIQHDFQLPQNTRQFDGNTSQQIMIPRSFKAKNAFAQQYETPTFQNKKFDDDDPVIKKNINQNPIAAEQPNIQIQIESLFRKGCLKEDQSQSLPACITIKADECKNQYKQTVDLFCVIDRSGSMFGDKIQNCQNSLLCLLEYLTPQDRLCLIQFDSYGKRLTPLKCVTDANKHYFRQVIKSIEAEGNDIISNGIDVALKQMRERKYKNDVTSIFLLSDGQDYSAKELVPAQLNKLKDPITLHTFGFGSDHDPQLLTFLASLRNGNFYFINRLDLLAEFFIDALGSVVSTVATNVQISFKCYGDQALQQLSIRKVYGNQWKMIQKDLEYQIQLEQISSGTKKDFVFEIFIPKNLQKVGQDRAIQIGKATIKYKQMYTNKIVEQSQNLELIIVNDIKKLNDNKRNINVALQLARVQQIEVLEQAALLCQQNQNEKAQQLLAQQLKKLQQQFELKDIQDLIQDIEESIKSCKREVYQQYGQQQMCSIQYNGSNQKGISTQFVDGVQQMPQQQGIYQNSTQYAMTQQVQQRI